MITLVHTRVSLVSRSFTLVHAGTDEGFGINMRQFRWAQTANYGTVPNPRMPNTFMADGYDLVWYMAPGV